MKTMRLRVGRLARQVAGESALLDAVLPRYEVASRHSMIVRASAATVYDSLLAMEPGRAPLVRGLMGMRMLPARITRRGQHGVPGSAGQAAGVGRFLLLAEQPGRERVLGLAGQFWRPTGNVAPLADAAAWQAHRVPGTAKAALTLRVEPIDHATARLYTETRVHTYGRQARRHFRLYWLVIGPFSGLIRRSLLRQVKRTAEHNAGLFILTP